MIFIIGEILFPLIFLGNNPPFLYIQDVKRKVFEMAWRRNHIQTHPTIDL